MIKVKLLHTFPCPEIWGVSQPEHDGHCTAGHDREEVAGPEVDEDQAGQTHLARL